MDTIEYDQASLMIALIQMTHGRWDVEELIAMHGYILEELCVPPEEEPKFSVVPFEKATVPDPDTP
jgi:hypothetical protein